VDSNLQLGLALASGVVLAAACGLRAFLPLLALGIAGRLGWLHLAPAMQWLQHPAALSCLGAATLIEIVGDKIPAVDHALDMISTVLRPAAGSLIAASVMWEVRDPLTALAVGVAVGAPSALVPHAAKSLLRAGSTALTGGRANLVLSLLEDVATVALFVLSVVVPVLVAAGLLLVAFLIVRRFARRPPSAVSAT